MNGEDGERNVYGLSKSLSKSSKHCFEYKDFENVMILQMGKWRRRGMIRKRSLDVWKESS